MEVFKDYAYYYNLIYAQKDYSKEAFIVDDFIIKFLQNYDVKEKISLLNMGCGTGRHDKELSKINSKYMIHGIDMSNSMIEIASADKNDGCTFEVADIREYRTEKKFDAVISLFHVLSYQITNDDIEKALLSAYHALKNSGVFIFDVWYGPGVVTEKPATRIKHAEDEKNLVIRNCEPLLYPNDNLVDVNYDVYIINKNDNEVKNIKELHKMRYFFKPELEYMLNKIGFQLKLVLDCENQKEPTYNSWTAYFIAVKNQ